MNKIAEVLLLSLIWRQILEWGIFFPGSYKLDQLTFGVNQNVFWKHIELAKWARMFDAWCIF